MRTLLALSRPGLARPGLAPPGLALLVLAGCMGTQPPERAVGMPNPASVYCGEQGGTLEIRNGPGGQSGYCHLPDGRVIEEWDLFRSRPGQDGGQ